MLKLTELLRIARYAGLDCHLVLRNSRALVDEDPGLVGNLLVERLVGAHVYQVPAPRRWHLQR